MEYVKILPSEQTYAKKDLLHSQMEILNVMKRYQRFKELRKQELALKGILKRKIAEVTEEVHVLDKALPRAPVERPEEEKTRFMVPVKKKRDLEAEIEEIKRKIERLQN